MDPWLLEQKATFHPGCLLGSPDTGGDPEGDEIRKQLIGMIRWASSNAPRSLQQAPGPSELGDLCDRRLGYKLAQVPSVNSFHDPWAATVGTAVHAWLENAMGAWQRAHRDDSWKTETAVKVDDFVSGHSDLYHNGVVIDYKTASPDKMKEYKKEVPAGYKVQGHLYGMGYENAGLPVRKIALFFLPRCGLLRNAHIWTADYDRTVAQAALDRMYGIAGTLVDLEVIANPHRWEQVPAHPSDSCGHCPWYDPDKILETGADDKGCPGR